MCVLGRIVYHHCEGVIAREREVEVLCSQDITVVQGRDDESLIWGSGKSKDRQI